MRIFTTVAEVTAAVGHDLGTSDWLVVEQDRVDAFADATGDLQWIHVDAARAAEGPFNGTIAHGYLTLSLIPYFGQKIFRIETPGPRLNYGLNKARFPAPVKVGSRLRASAAFTGIHEVAAGAQLTTRYVLEIEGQDKPACVAETVVLLLG